MMSHSPRRNRRLPAAMSLPAVAFATLLVVAACGDGASEPEELVEEAVRLGLEALALTDHDGFYGVVRFAEAAKAVAPLIAVDIDERHRTTIAHSLVGMAEGASRLLVERGDEFDPDQEEVFQRPPLQPADPTLLAHGHRHARRRRELRAGLPGLPRDTGRRCTSGPMSPVPRERLRSLQRASDGGPRMHGLPHLE